MAKSNGLNFNLPSVDDLFSTEEERAEARLEKVVNLSPTEISDFPNHPFKVRMDAAMQEMTESVKQYGVLVPALVRPKPEGGYEMVAGHRRKKAADLAGLAKIPCIVRQLTDDEATIIMVGSNLQREQILPSEKAFAYKMKLDALKRQGQRTDLTSSPLDKKLKGLTSAQQVSQKSGDSQPQIYRYIRLTELIPPMLDMVDSGKIAFRPAVELSYLSKEQQSKKEEEVVAKEKEVAELRRKYFGPEGELYKKRESLMQPIQDDIYNAVKKISEEKGYQMVIDRASDASIIFASPRIDISNEVLTKLGYSK